MDHLLQNIFLKLESFVSKFARNILTKYSRIIMPSLSWSISLKNCLVLHQLFRILSKNDTNLISVYFNLLVLEYILKKKFWLALLNWNGWERCHWEIYERYIEYYRQLKVQIYIDLKFESIQYYIMSDHSDEEGYQLFK